MTQGIICISVSGWRMWAGVIPWAVIDSASVRVRNVRAPFLGLVKFITRWLMTLMTRRCEDTEYFGRFRINNQAPDLIWNSECRWPPSRIRHLKISSRYTNYATINNKLTFSSFTLFCWYLSTTIDYYAGCLVNILPRLEEWAVIHPADGSNDPCSLWSFLFSK